MGDIDGSSLQTVTIDGVVSPSIMMKGPRYYESEYGLDYSKQNGTYSDGKPLLDKGSPVVYRQKRTTPFLYVLIVVACIGVVFLFSRVSLSSSISNLRSSSFKDGLYTLYIVSDLDKKSKVDSDSKGKWRSVLKKGQMKVYGVLLRLEQNPHHWYHNQSTLPNHHICL